MIKITLWAFLIMGFLSGIPTQAKIQPPSIYAENAAYQFLSETGRFYNQVNLDFSPQLLKRFGGSYRLIYGLGLTAVDLQLGYLSTNWRGVSTNISQSELAASQLGTIPSINPGAELTRARSEQDPWSRMLVEVGYGVRGRLSASGASRWIQSARASLGYAILRDQANSLQFSGVTLGVEAGVMAQMSQNLLFGPSLGYHFGWAHLSSGETNNFNRIPLVSFEGALSMMFRL
jgi:hypothetical protein